MSKLYDSTNLDTTYRQWYNLLDAACSERYGLGHSDMPDLTMIRDLYDDNCSVTEALDICFEAWASDYPIFSEVYYG